MKIVKLAFVMLLLTFSAKVLAETPEDSVYLDGGESSKALILAHGKGKHPTWLVVDPVRKGVHEELGYHTISLQMPTGFSDWREYADGFPDAYQTFEQAISFLKKEKNVTHVYLFGHSMGSRMASAYLSDTSDGGVSGLIVAGCRNNGGRPLSCDQNLEGVKVPVLDVWGGNNGKDSRSAEERSGMVSDRYTQVEIVDANHKFEDSEDELVEAVVEWLKNQK